MKLNFRVLGGGEPILVLHGVFGSADNWQTVGKELATKYQVYLIDLRNHGQSPHDKEMNYWAMSDDIHELCVAEGISGCHVIGHSMGGKVGMFFACRFPELVNQLVVVDIAPKYYVPHHQNIFDAFHSVDLQSIGSRREADDQVAAVVDDLGVRQFILKNLLRGGDGFSWKLNLTVIESHIEELGQGLPADFTFEKETLFIRGTTSDYISKDDERVIAGHFPKSKILNVAAGHWVHAEKPREVLAAVVAFFA